MSKENKKVRLSMDIEPKLHKLIKYYALMRNITLTEWVLEAIGKEVAVEEGLIKDD